MNETFFPFEITESNDQALGIDIIDQNKNITHVSFRPDALKCAGARGKAALLAAKLEDFFLHPTETGFLFAAAVKGDDQWNETQKHEHPFLWHLHLIKRAQPFLFRFGHNPDQDLIRPIRFFLHAHYSVPILDIHPLG